MRSSLAYFLVALAAIALSGAQAQTPPAAQPVQPPASAARRAPPFATTKVEGTDNVYIFRYGNHQSMFVVTPEGVIATDPISYGRPQAAVTYVDEIKKITPQSIRYLVYSHHHYDHIAGGKPFKDAVATIIAHRRAKERNPAKPMATARRRAAPIHPARRVSFRALYKSKASIPIKNIGR